MTDLAHIDGNIECLVQRVTGPHTSMWTSLPTGPKRSALRIALQTVLLNFMIECDAIDIQDRRAPADIPPRFS